MIERQRLELSAHGPRPLSVQRQERWREVRAAFAEQEAWACVIFLAELLERLDPGTKSVVEGRLSFGDMGEESSELRVSNGKRGVRRVVDNRYDSFELKVTGSWQYQEWGFDEEETLGWSGGLTGRISLDTAAATHETREIAASLAAEIFETVEVRWGGDPKAPPPPLPRERAESLTIKGPVEDGAALVLVHHDLYSIVGEKVLALFRTVEDAVEFRRLMREDLVDTQPSHGSDSWVTHEVRAIRQGKLVSVQTESRR